MMEVYFWVTIGACALSILFSILTIRSLNLLASHSKSVRSQSVCGVIVSDVDDLLSPAGLGHYAPDRRAARGEIPLVDEAEVNDDLERPISGDEKG